MIEFEILDMALAGLAGATLAGTASWYLVRSRLGGLEQLGADILKKAEQEADMLRQKEELSLKEARINQEHDLERKLQSEKSKLQRQEERIKRREDQLEQRLQWVQKKLTETEKQEKHLLNESNALKLTAADLAEKQQHLATRLENLADLSSSDAREQLLQQVKSDTRLDAKALKKRLIRETRDKADREAKQIVIAAINRVCVGCASDATVTTVPLPNDDVKGRIIGREGRNVRSFERATGVNVLIDDTPGAVVLSGFDPMRKHIAKLAMLELVSDGRIHPTRIEEVVEAKQKEVDVRVIEYGEDAALRAGVAGLHPELLRLLGQLSFRFSYGQNVLDHSVEVSHLMTLMAAELGLDTALAKRIGLLHDIGKALPRQRDLTHALAGQDLVKKYGESTEVANGVGCHHREIEATTLEGSLCSAADSISASRPGARIEAIEDYVKRLRELENLTDKFPGVERAYAMQAGKEVHVSVLPNMVDDSGIETLAQDVAAHIEKELKFPGRIKVVVVREQRVIKYAVS